MIDLTQEQIRILCQLVSDELEKLNTAYHDSIIKMLIKKEDPINNDYTYVLSKFEELKNLLKSNLK